MLGQQRAIMPLMPVAAYRTFAITNPVSTHYVSATCAEVDCVHWRNGWRVRVEDLTPQLLHTARASGRKYTELRVADGETWLVFESGQPCFRASQHMRRLDRPSLFSVRDGDWRGNPFGTPVRRHTKPEFWVEEMSENLDRLATEIQRG
jgi:hypothetical protein